MPIPEGFFGFMGRPAGSLALDLLRLGIALLGRDGGIVYRNPAFDELIARGCGLLVTAGRPRADRRADNVRLQQAIAACIAPDADPGRPCDLALWGPRGEHSIVVSVLPLPCGEEGPDVAQAILLAVDTTPMAELDERFMRSAFRFSAAESYLARRLLQGATLAEVAASKGITVNTARSQLRAIMQKTGVSRQGELINLLSRCDVVRRASYRTGARTADQPNSPRHQSQIIHLGDERA